MHEVRQSKLVSVLLFWGACQLSLTLVNSFNERFKLSNVTSNTSKCRGIDKASRFMLSGFRQGGPYFKLSDKS